MESDVSPERESPPRDSNVAGWVSTHLLNLKAMLVICASISMGLLISAIVTDTYILTYTGHSVKYERLGLVVTLPDSRIGMRSVTVRSISSSKEVVPTSSDGKDTPSPASLYMYTDLADKSESFSTEQWNEELVEAYLSSDLVNFLGFRLPITTIEYASAGGKWVTVFQWTAVGLMGLGILLQLIFRTVPDSFVLKPGIALRFSLSRFEVVKPGLPGFCLMLGAICLAVSAVITSSYVHNFVYRLIVYSIFNARGASGSNLAAWRLSMKQDELVPAKQERLRFMQYVGKFLNEKESVAFGFSFYAILFAIAINLLLLFTLYYQDNLNARTKAAETVACLSPSIAVEAMTTEQHWNQLPWHCRVRPLWMSALVLLFGLCVTAVGGNVARRRGLKMNRHPYEVAGKSQSFIDDVVISHTNDYFFSTAGIVDGAVMIFMPLLVMVAISSFDRVRFASKCLELLGIIFFMRGISVMATIMPTLFNVLQHPQCWDQPSKKVADMIMEKEFCNDLMFSGHTVFAMFPAMIFAFSIIYGPYSYKPFIVGSVLICALSLTSLIVAGRLHYSADVLVAIVLCGLLVTMNAPVWKLQFSYRKAQTGFGNISAIDKVPGYLEQCIEKLNDYSINVQNQQEGGNEPQLDDKSKWNTVELIYEELGTLLNDAKALTVEQESLKDNSPPDLRAQTKQFLSQPTPPPSLVYPELTDQSDDESNNNNNLEKQPLLTVVNKV